jgi:molecular chaperone GrpE (heat shock protein)
MAESISNTESTIDEGAGDGYARIAQAVQDGNSQTMFLRQQVGQLHEVVNQLYGAVRAQCLQLGESDAAIIKELQKFQTGGPQRAMAGVYAKLFRDLIKHMNELDHLVGLAENAGTAMPDDSWVNALRIVRDQFERVLREWGCNPVETKPGQQEFDPEIHEAVASADAVQTSSGENRIIAVRRRGWAFGDTLLQHPQVIVG